MPSSRVIEVILAAAFGLAAAAPLPSHAASATLERIKENRAITFAYREGAAPFSFKDRAGRVQGYSVELCTRVAASIQKSLGLPELKIEWVPVDAANRIEAVTSGKADAVCGTTSITLSRMESVDFSLPIYVDGGTVMTRSKTRLARLADLKGRKVAVIGGTTTEQSLVRAFNVIDMTAVLVPVKDAAEGLSLLNAGAVDGYAGDRIVLTTMRQRSANPRDYTLLDGDFSFEPYGLVVRRDDADFRLAVNRALVAVYRSGDIDGIFQRWLGSMGRPGPLLHSMFYLNTLPE